MKKIVLAFSGGLDTSFCVPYLIEKGFDVYTIFINSGGISQKQEKIIEKKAYQLGAKKHVSKNVEKELCKSIVTPLLWSDSVYQNKYPILCSDRYLIVQEMVNLRKKLRMRSSWLPGRLHVLAADLITTWSSNLLAR